MPSLRYILHSNNNIDIVIKLAIAIVFSAILSVIVHRMIPKLPIDSDISGWTNFTHQVDISSSKINTSYIVCTLMVLHAVHFVCCVPFMFVTKMMYGHFLGIAKGCIVCILWEVLMLILFVASFSTYDDPKHPINSMRFPIDRLCRKLGIYNTIAAAQISSIPISCTCMLFTSGAVTRTQYTTVHVLVTVVNSSKDVFMGVLLHTIYQNNTDSIMFIILLVATTTIPSALAFLLFTGVFYNVHVTKCIDECEENKTLVNMDEHTDVVVPTSPRLCGGELDVIFESDNDKDSDHEIHDNVDNTKSK
jgi:hypothetical protein